MLTQEEIKARDAAHFAETGRHLQKAYLPFMDEGRGKSKITYYMPVHALTCGGIRGDAAHTAYAQEHGLDNGELEHFPDGRLACPVCDYEEKHRGALALADPMETWR